MSRFWKSVSVTGGAVAILFGALLLMGNLRQSHSQAVQLEQARLETLARLWESRLEAARETFHDQLVQYDLLTILERPAEWNEPRVEPRLSKMAAGWTPENGKVRALIVMLPTGQIHTSFGDTTGLAAVLNAFARDPHLNLLLMQSSADAARLLALDYKPPQLESAIAPGRMLALLDASSLLSPTEQASLNWMLLAAPDITLAASSLQPPRIAISDAVWTLLVNTPAGAIPQPDGGTLCFARLMLPGSAPLLLVQPNRIRDASALFGVALLFIGLGTLLASALRKRIAPAANTETSVPVESDSSGAEATGLRHVFQAIDDPLCVIDGNGGLLRANHKAQEWLHSLKPDGTPAIHLARGTLSLIEFFSRAAEDPAAVSAPCRLTLDGQRAAFNLQATRLYREDNARGPVLLHFRPQTVTERARSLAESVTAAPNSVESACPFPVLDVTPAGLVTSYNEAARQVCPKLATTPLLSELLPGIDVRSLPELLAAGPGTTFESLFGSSPHEFTLVRGDDRLLLYAHRLTDSKQLEVELKQAQENFFGLCSLVPAAILLVDPRDHAIIEANAAAGDLFRGTVASLRGRELDSLSDGPWDAASGDDRFTAVTLDGGLVTCAFRFELIKIEGVPTLLVILEPDPPVHESSSVLDVIMAAVPSPPAAPPAVPTLPDGPGILVTLDPTVREVARRLLDKTGHACETFTCLDDATVWLITHDLRPELIAVDLMDFDDTEGWISELRARCGDVPCLAFTDGLNYVLPSSGPNALLPKPFDLDALADALRELNLESALAV
jgi:PAS domain-containing protein